MSSGFFRGTNTEQDSRWGDAEKKLLRRTKFSKVLEQKVNMKKVNMDVMQRWISQRITSLLGFEDDIVVGTCVNYLAEEGKLDPKKLQLQLTGFLEKSTGMFMEELWGLLVDAQNSLGGIPSAFLQDKKQEMLQAKEQERKQGEELLQKMAEHQQEMMGKAALLTQPGAATVNGAGPTSVSPVFVSGKPTEGRRASRWGSSEAVVTATPAVGFVAGVSSVPITDGGADNAPEESTSWTLGRKPVVQSTGTEEAAQHLEHEKGDNMRPRSPEKSWKHSSSRSRRDSRDEDSGKEKKRKSKRKHGKKSDRKKSKTDRRSGEEREQHRSRKKDADGRGAEELLKSDDEDSSSGDDEDDKVTVPAVDAKGAEEALRLRVLASMKTKKGNQNQDDNRY